MKNFLFQVEINYKRIIFPEFTVSFFQYSHADWLLSFVHTSNESIHS